jgi:hypothetical protein
MTILYHTPKIVGDSLSNPDSINIVLSELDTAIKALSTKISVMDKDLTAPPGTPTNAYPYIPAATATGLWAGLEDQLVFTGDGGTTWISEAPAKGLKVYMIDEAISYEWDGTAWVMADRYIIPISYNGIPDDGWMFFRHEPVYPIRFVVDLTGTGSKLYGGLAATAETIITLKKNGSAFGTLTVPAAGTDAVIAVGTQTDFLTTDLLTLTYQATKDVTFGDIGGNIVGIKK